MDKKILIGGGLILAGIAIYLLTKIKKIAKIISANFQRLNGIIRNTVIWDAGETHNFVLTTIYGIDYTGKLEGFDAQHWSSFIRITSDKVTNTTDIDMDIPLEVGTYDALTIVGDGDEPNFPYGGAGVYDYRINKSVLTI